MTPKPEKRSVGRPKLGSRDRPSRPSRPQKSSQGHSQGRFPRQDTKQSPATSSPPKLRRNTRPSQAEASPSNGSEPLPTQSVDATELKEDEASLLYGRHSVLAALDSEHPLNRIWVIPKLLYDPRFHSQLRQAKSRGAVIDEVDPRRLDQITQGANHQGIAAQAASCNYCDLEALIQIARQTTRSPVLLAADSITDPHNLGAMIRTAEAMGAQGLILPQRRAVGVTPTVMKVASGALANFPIARVTNLTQAIEDLKQAGFWIYGAVAAEGQPSQAVKFAEAAVLAIGSEGNGLSLRVQNSCDVLVSIPLRGKVASLNASVATGMLLYELYRQRHGDKIILEPKISPD